MSQAKNNKAHDINVQRLARLSRIALTKEQETEAARELKKMADYTYSLIRSDDIALPFSYSSAKPSMREDIVAATDTQLCEDIVALAPSSTDGHITVPRVIKEEKK